MDKDMQSEIDAVLKASELKVAVKEYLRKIDSQKGSVKDETRLACLRALLEGLKNNTSPDADGCRQDVDTWVKLVTMDLADRKFMEKHPPGTSMDQARSQWPYFITAAAVIAGGAYYYINHVKRNA